MRVTRPSLACLVGLSLGACSSPSSAPRRVEMVPIGTEVGHGPAERPRDDGVTGVNSAAPEPLAHEGPAGVCTLEGSDLAEIYRAGCELEGAPTATTASLKDVEVSAQPVGSPAKAGSPVDVEVTLKNRGAEPVVVQLTGGAEPAFDLATSDARGRRVDVPAGRPPRAKGAPAARKVYQLTLAAGQSAKARAVWEASKMRWAPERVKDLGDKPYPRAGSAPLAPGKYVVVVHPPFALASGKDKAPSGRFDVDVVR